MNRRNVLIGFSGVLTIFAGCSDSGSEQTRTVARTATPSPIQTRASGSVESLERALSDTGIDVNSISSDTESAAIELRYVSANPQSQDTVTSEIGTIAGEFYNSIDGGLDADRLNATVVSPEGEGKITWYAEREWYIQLKNEELTPEELTIQVVETAEGV